MKFETSTGTVTVETWGYQLQGTKGLLNPSLLASATHDLLVIDSSRDGTEAYRFTADEIARMKDGMGGRSVVVSYTSIGEASDFRDYWHDDWTTTGEATGRLTGKAPDWLGPVNPDWPESRKVRYWDEDWQKIVFNDQKTGELDAIVKAGFDAAYLDIVDGYYFWGAEVAARDREAGDPANVKQAAQRMVDFIVALTEHARETNPDFFVIPQNGGWILNDLGHDPARKKAYLDAIGGIAVEDIYYGGNKDENNPLNPDEAMIRILKRDFVDKGIPVFVVDYVNGDRRVAQFNKLALEDGFIVALTEHARETNPDFFVIPQNGGWILNDLGHDPARKKAYLDAIGGIAVEDIYYGGNKDENNPLNPDEAMIRILKRDFVDKGIPVFVVDYVNGDRRVAQFNKLALEDGFIPFASPDRDLDRLVGTFDGDPAYIRPTGKADTLRGSQLTDTINGRAGNDTIDGRAGNDLLKGAAGDDHLIGGAGVDKLYGGRGADSFVFKAVADFAPSSAGRDTVLDFSRRQGDAIDLKAIDADRTQGGNQAFDFIGSGRFSDTAGELRYRKAAGDTFVYGDVDGDGRADFSLRIDGGFALAKGDFIL